MTVIAASSVSVKTMADDTLRLTVDIEPRHAQEAFAMFGSRGTPLALARLTQSAAGEAMSKSVEEESRPGGDLMRDLVRLGFFNNPLVMHNLGGSDVEFQSYVRGQSSCLNGDTEGVVYAHVRRANNSGTGTKPPYSGVPLTNKQHSEYQHQAGEAACLNAWKPRMDPERPGATIMWTVDEAKDWFDRKAAQLRADWGRKRMLDEMNDAYDETCESVAEYKEIEIIAFLDGKGLFSALPRKWKESSAYLRKRP